jgi:hypothetical protein
VHVDPERFEPATTPKDRELHDQYDGDNFSTGAPNKVDSGCCSTTGSQHIINKDDSSPWAKSVGLQLQGGGPVLQGVVNAVHRSG